MSFPTTPITCSWILPSQPSSIVIIELGVITQLLLDLIIVDEALNSKSIIVVLSGISSAALLEETILLPINANVSSFSLVKICFTLV